MGRMEHLSLRICNLTMCSPARDVLIG
jgi:hypothetical protein